MEITKSPAKILYNKTQPVKNITGDIRTLADEMRIIMKANNGVGLAATQVGRNLQIFVIDENLARENNVPEIYINPEISEYSKDIGVLEEGCLSLPDFWKDINRSKKVKLKALDIAPPKIFAVTPVNNGLRCRASPV